MEQSQSPVNITVMLGWELVAPQAGQMRRTDMYEKSS